MMPLFYLRYFNFRLRDLTWDSGQRRPHNSRPNLCANARRCIVPRLSEFRRDITVFLVGLSFKCCQLTVRHERMRSYAEVLLRNRAYAAEVPVEIAHLLVENDAAFACGIGDRHIGRNIEVILVADLREEITDLIFKGRKIHIVPVGGK